MPPDDALFEYMDEPKTLTVVEWIQFLDKKHWPEEAIFLEWTPSDTGRSLMMHAMGKTTQGIIETLMRQLDQFILKAAELK